MIPGQYRTRCEKNQLPFQELLAIKQKTVRTDVGGGISTAGPWEGWDWEPSNDGNKQINTSNMQLQFRNAEYVNKEKCRIC
jgi:hypothetical protein